MNRREFLSSAALAAAITSFDNGKPVEAFESKGERNWLADELNAAHLKATFSAGPMNMQALWRNTVFGDCRRECSQVGYAYIGFDLNDGTEEIDPALLIKWLNGGWHERQRANPFVVRCAEVTDKMIKKFNVDRPTTEFHDDGTFTFVIFADGEKDESGHWNGKGRVGRAEWDFKTERWI